jgi:hypothetical protein
MNADVSQKSSELIIIIIITYTTTTTTIVVVVIIWMSLVTGLFSPIFLLNQQ